jgi:hypothetical protein
MVSTAPCECPSTTSKGPAAEVEAEAEAEVEAEARANTRESKACEKEPSTYMLTTSLINTSFTLHLSH